MARAQKVSYFAMQIPNRPGEAGRILSGLAKAGVNLLAFTGFPNGRNSQVDFISRQPDHLSRGRARHQVLDRLAPGLEGPVVIYACGPHGMLAAVPRWAMTNGARAHLAMESVMACGTGVCRGCPLPRSAAARDRVLAQGAWAAALQGNPEWAMCCTDGPGFESRELDWDRVE